MYTYFSSMVMELVMYRCFWTRVVELFIYMYIYIFLDNSDGVSYEYIPLT